MAINRLSRYEFAISQSISGSFAAGDTVEASFLAKGNHTGVNMYVTQFVDLKSKIPSPPAALISTDKKFITFLKLRLEFVAVGEFEFPNAEIIDPFKVE